MSRQYFDFSQLIADYENEFTVITTAQDHFNERGDLVKGQESQQSMSGAIIGFRESKLFRSDGTLTAKDKHLFMLQRLPDALVGAKVLYKGQQYLIESETENAEFTGVYSYVLRWCSAIVTVR